MAGMFIDRMRSAQTAEQGPQPTVAQQVLTPQPAPAAPAGLGAMPPMGGGAPLPQEAPPMTAADGGLMSSGGLSTLPVPNDMFDEPHGVSMADGGIVAFAGSGLVEAAPFAPPEKDTLDYGFGPFMSRQAAKIGNALDAYDASQAAGRTKLATQGIVYKNGKYYDQNGHGVQPVANSKVLNAETGNYFLVPSSDPRAVSAPTATTNTPAPTTTPNPYIAAALANQGTAPATTVPPKGLAALVPAAKAPAAKAPADTGKSKTRTAAVKALTSNLAPAAAQSVTDEFGVPTSLQGGVDFVKKAMEPLSTDALKAMQKEIADTPDRLKKQKQEDLWSSLAQIGFGMAATKSPSFLQAFGESAGAALPGMQAALKERRAAERDATKQALELENLQYGRTADIVKAGTELGIEGRKLLESKLSREQQERLEMYRIAEARKEAAAGRTNALEAARIGQNTTTDRNVERIFQGLLAESPNKDPRILYKEAVEAVLSGKKEPIPPIPGLDGLQPGGGKQLNYDKNGKPI
jgi:hypothetical protein